MTTRPVRAGSALARQAVADGGRPARVAGGDGTQALVAGIAAEHGIPLLVISAGTRNHGSRPARRDPRARMVRMPGSTSFPSGHSASAFAFATAVGDELPLAWLPLHTVAAAITSSRVPHRRAPSR